METATAQNVLEITRRCTKCGEDKPLSAFKRRYRSDRSHFQSRECKACLVFAMKKWRQKNPEKTLAASDRATALAKMAEERRVAAEAMPTHRKCSICKATKPISDYTKDSRGPFQKSRRCRACERASASAWRAENKAVIAAKHVRAVAAHNAEEKKLKREAEMPIGRVCGMCKVLKPHGAFNRSSADRYGTCSICAECNRVKALAWGKKNASKRRATAKYQHLFQKYGLTRETFEMLLASQGSKCAICRDQLNLHYRTHVDHSHRTGKIRGILCGKCNSGLGMFKDDADILAAALTYLSDREG